MYMLFAFLRKFLGIAFFLYGLFIYYIYFRNDFSISHQTEMTVYAIFIALAALLSIVWTFMRSKVPNNKLYYILQLSIRCTLAYMFIIYALSKIYNTQFGADPETYRKPVGELSSFALAWIFFGHSYNYGVFIASTQILASILLLNRSTQTLGALIFFGMLTNILVIDFEFDVTMMQIATSVMLAMTVYLLALDYKRILHFAGGRIVQRSYFVQQPLTKFHKICWAIGVAVVLTGVVIDSVMTYKYFHPKTTLSVFAPLRLCEKLSTPISSASHNSA